MVIAAKIEKASSRALIFALRHRKILWLFCFILLVFALFSTFFFGSYGNDIKTLFPKNSDAGKALASMQRSQAANTVVLEFDTGQKNGAVKIEPWLDQLASRLEKLEFVNSLTFRLSNFAEDAAPEKLISAIPLLYDVTILDNANPATAVSQMLRQAAMPVPGVVARHRHDPFGFSLKIFNELEVLKDLAGMEFSPEHLFIANRDASRAAIILDLNPLTIGDAVTVRKIFSKLKAEWKDLPVGVQVNIISPLTHTLGNEETIKSDIIRISLFSILFLGILFFVLYRGDLRALWIPLIPICASLFVVGVMAVSFDKISLFIIGVGAGLLGLAVDQGIHVYTAFSGKSRIRRLGRIFLPMLLAVATSACVFLMLVTSGIGAYIQLGIFASAALMVSFLLSYFILPTLQKRAESRRFSFVEFTPTRAKGRLIVLIWFGLIVFCGLSVKNLKKDFSLSTFDGTPADVLEQERDFERVWRSAPAPAMIVLTGDSQDAVAKDAEQWHALLKTNKVEAFVPSALWPSQATREKNLAGWRTSQSLKKLEHLETALIDECIKKGLPKAFFNPFFEQLRQALAVPPEIPPRLVNEALSRMIKKYPDWVTEIIFVKNTPGNISFIYKKAQGQENCAVISRDAFNEMVSTDFYLRFTRILLIAVIVLILLALPLFPSPLAILLIMLPGLTAIVTLCGLLVLLGMPINIIICFSLILLSGLAFDYGILSLHHVRSGDKDSSIPSSMFLSGATSVFSTGAMLFSSHPIMFHTGLTLSVGLAVACLTGLYVVPSLYSLFKKIRPKSLVLFMAFPIAFALSACTSIEFTPEKFAPRNISRAQIISEIATDSSTYSSDRIFRMNAKFQYLWYSFPIILVGKTSHHNSEISVTGISPAGMMVFEISGSNGKVTKEIFSPAIPKNASSKLFSTLYYDLTNIFYRIPDECGIPSNTASTPVEIWTEDTPEIQSIRWVFDGEPLRVTTRMCGTFPARQWLAVYREWDNVTKQFGKIAYKNYNTGVKIILRPIASNKEIE